MGILVKKLKKFPTYLSSIKHLFTKERLRIKLNKAGWGYIILTLLLGFTAVNSNNNLTYLIVSIMLALMTISGILAVVNLLGVQVTNPHQDILTAKREGYIFLNIKNLKLIPSFLLEVSLDKLTVKIPYLKPSNNKITLIKWFPDKRGVYTFERLQIGSSFPFSFIWRGYDRQINLQVFVAPEPLKYPLPSRGTNKNLSTQGLTYNIGSGDWLGIKWSPKIEGKAGIIWKKIDWNLRDNLKINPPFPYHQFASEGNYFYFDIDDPLLQNHDLETKLKILRHWIDTAHANHATWIIKLNDKPHSFHGKLGYENCLKLLAEYNSSSK